MKTAERFALDILFDGIVRACGNPGLTIAALHKMFERKLIVVEWSADGIAIAPENSANSIEKLLKLVETGGEI